MFNFVYSFNLCRIFFGKILIILRLSVEADLTSVVMKQLAQAVPFVALRSLDSEEESKRIHHLIEVPRL